MSDTAKIFRIRDLAFKLCKTTGYAGELIFDASKPDGTPRKLMDSSKIRDMGWRPTIALEEGLRRTYDWYLTHVAER